MIDLPGTCLSAYVDGVLGAEEAARIDRHVEHCAVCRRRLDDLRAVVDALRAAAPEDETPDVAPHVLRAAAAVDARRERTRVRLRHAGGTSLLALVALAFGLSAGRTSPVLLGSSVLQVLRALWAAGVDLPVLPAWVRLGLLAVLLLVTWGALRRLARALRQAEPGL